MVDSRAKVYRENADDCRAQAARDQPEKEKHGSNWRMSGFGSRTASTT
jgi:hypothetical protein